MAHDLYYLPFWDIVQSFEEGIEVLARIHFLCFSKHSADTDGEPFLFWKDPTIAIRNSTKIQMDELKFLMGEMDG